MQQHGDAAHADLFMHPQSCVIEELDDEENQQEASTTSSSSAQAHAATAEASGDDAAAGQAEAGRAASSSSDAAPQSSSSNSSQPTAGEAAAADTPQAAADGSAEEGPSAGAGGGGGDAEHALDPQQLQQLVEECERLKQDGNAAYARGEYDEALQLYWQALDRAPEGAQQRAVYYANAAACYLKQELWQLAAEQCTQALKLDDGYIKALVRRSQALRELDDLEHALADAQRVLELDAGNAWAAKAVSDLTPEVQRRQEKLKEEMLGKLKDLGNSVLGKFGLSLDNFEAEQDPNTGGYSIKFVQ